MSTKFILTFLVFTGVSITLYANPSIDEGKIIFQTRCAACHGIDKQLIGPVLAGVDQRYSMDWIINFIRSSQTLRNSGDKVAIENFNKFNKIPMPDNLDLTDEQIKSILEYIISESKPAEAAQAPFAIPGKKRPNYTPVTLKDYGFFIGYTVVVLMLVVAMLFAVQARSFQRKMPPAPKGE